MINRIANNEAPHALLLRNDGGYATSSAAGTNGQRTIDRNNKTSSIIKLFYSRNFKTGFVLISLFFVSGCKNDEKMIEDWSKKKVMVDVAKNIESYLSQEGKVKAKLKAPLMFRYETDTVYFEFPKTLHVDFYNDSTKIETWVDSKHGKYFENLNKVYLWDSVVVINVQGDTLKSNDLWWDQDKKLFYTDNYAEYRTKDKQIFPGKGLEATEDFKSIIFKQPIGTVEVSDKNFSK
ncbi:MAG: LPS export ABC transporter periplasmic protein LptC [Chitinophagales bacterium]